MSKARVYGLPDWMGFVITRAFDVEKIEAERGLRWLDISYAGPGEALSIQIVEATRFYAMVTGMNDQLDRGLFSVGSVRDLHKQGPIALDPRIASMFGQQLLPVASDYGYERGPYTVDIWWFDRDHAFTRLTSSHGTWGWIHGAPVHDVSEELITEVINA